MEEKGNKVTQEKGNLKVWPDLLVDINVEVKRRRISQHDIVQEMWNLYTQAITPANAGSVNRTPLGRTSEKQVLAGIVKPTGTSYNIGSLHEHVTALKRVLAEFQQAANAAMTAVQNVSLQPEEQKSAAKHAKPPGRVRPPKFKLSKKLSRKSKPRISEDPRGKSEDSRREPEGDKT